MRSNGNLLRVCKTALEEVILDPSVRIDRMTVRKLPSHECRHAGKNNCILVTVFTNDASMVRGAAQAYKGSYKERVEGVLEYFVRKSDINAHAHLEIVGPETASVERLVSIEELIRIGKLAQESPLAATGKAYGIDYALIRGRHLIGPCPAIATVLKRIIKMENIHTVLDIFAGTGVATKVAFALGKLNGAEIIENDPIKVERMKSHMLDLPVQFEITDAFEFRIENTYDLIVADPYFEDIPHFLEKQLNAIRERAKIFVLVSGATQDITWNRRISRSLIKSGFKVRRHTQCGEVVFVARSPQE